METEEDSEVVTEEDSEVAETETMDSEVAIEEIEDQEETTVTDQRVVSTVVKKVIWPETVLNVIFILNISP